MAILVDHDDHTAEPFTDHANGTGSIIAESQTPNLSDNHFNSNTGLFSAALTCYPVISLIAQHLDLNTLHNLSLSCRQFRLELLQYRTQLIRQTLRCSNETVDLGPRLADRIHEWRSNRASRTTPQSPQPAPRRFTSGRVGKCARDMVGECRRCGIIVCRNCTIKPPPSRALQHRHRRLCRTCQSAPLYAHLSTFPLSVEDGDTQPYRQCFTTPAFQRSPCICEEAVHICLSCGNALRSADTTYIRGWNWRTRYSALGTGALGLATGIGEGNEGVECGRGAECLAAREVEKEIACDAEEVQASFVHEVIPVEYNGGHGDARSRYEGGGYWRQEIEGIGGVVKKKVKVRVKVGDIVEDYEDERVADEFLRRERERRGRSWCFWCMRIILSEEDRSALIKGTGA